MKRYFWIIMSLVMFMPAAATPWLIDVQMSLWMFCVDIIKPNPTLLFASIYYWPVLLVLTGWYWIWRFMRWIFDDEGPLPRFRLLLFIMWAPVYVIPTIILISGLGWLGCLVKAHQVEEVINDQVSKGVLPALP